MISADVDGSPAAFLGFAVLPLGAPVLALLLDSVCALFFLAMVFCLWDDVAQ